MFYGYECMDISSAVPFEVYSTSDLARWIVSSTSNQHGTLYCVNYNGKTILCSLVSFPGYYNYTGLPILLFTYVEAEPSGSFVRFDVRADSKNQLSYVSGFDESEANLGYIQYIPIIKLKTIPAIFNFEH